MFRRDRIVIFAVSAAVAVHLSTIHAAEDATAPAVDLVAAASVPESAACTANGTCNDPSSGVYCGLYCMFAALRAHNRSVEFEDLLDMRYVSSSFGSSLADLKLLAEDYGLKTLPMKGMTAAMLRDSPYPIVLHTRTARRGSPFTHWILYLGTADGRARIVDPPNAPEEVSFADILCRWDGVGLVVADRPISRWRAMRLGWVQEANLVLPALLVVVLAVGLTAGRSTTANRGLARGSFAGVAAILGLSLVLAVAHHVLSADGVLRNPQAIATVLTTHHATHLPEISAADVQSLIQDPNVVVIDARFARDYALGAVPHAVNIPINATASARALLYAGVPREARVVVYCQSAGCGYSDEIGSDLVFRGYKDVALFRGGYREWREYVANRK